MRIAFWAGQSARRTAPLFIEAIDNELRKRGHFVTQIVGVDEGTRQLVVETRADIVHAFDFVWRAGQCPKPDVLDWSAGTEFQHVQVRLKRVDGPWKRAWERFCGLLRFDSLEMLGRERDLPKDRPLPLSIAPSHYVAQQLTQFLGLREEELTVVPPPYVAPPYPHEFGPPSAEARAESRRREFSFINARQGNADGGGFGDGDVLVFRSRRRDGVDADAGRFDAALGKVRSELKTWRKPIGVCVVDHVFGPAADGADFLVEATWDSPDGRATLPYLAKQIPVITTKYNGAAELIDDRVNGFVIDSPDDVESLADRMLRLCDSVTRFRFRSNLREVSQYLRIERYVDDLLALYEDILRRKRGGGDSGDPPAGGTGFAV